TVPLQTPVAPFTHRGADPCESDVHLPGPQEHRRSERGQTTLRELDSDGLTMRGTTYAKRWHHRRRIGPDGRGRGHGSSRPVRPRHQAFPTAPEVSAGTAAAPPRLSPEELAGAQAESLAAPRRRYRVAARALFVTLD